MKLCIITPVPNLGRFASLGDAHLMLTHLIEPGNDYTQFYAGRRELKILDNGLFEHHVAAPTSEIIAKGKLVGADVVIAPDVLYDAVGTVKNAEAFAKEIYMENGRRRGKGLRPLQMMAVPQATNRKDYLWCYSQLTERLQFPWIGLSILGCPSSFTEETGTKEPGPNRIAAYKALKESGLWQNTVNHHLLGLGSFIHETSFFAPIKSVVSNDSSSPLLHAGMGIQYVKGEVPGGKRPDKMDFSVGVDPKHYQLALNNIQTWRYLSTFSPAELG